MSYNVHRPHPNNLPGAIPSNPRPRQDLNFQKLNTHRSQYFLNQQIIAPQRSNNIVLDHSHSINETNQDSSYLPSIRQQPRNQPIKPTIAGPQPLTNRPGIAQKKVANKLILENTNNPNPKDYRAIKIIGQGAFGVVYIARAPGGTSVAIKKVLQDPRYKNREYDILKLIDNQYCIKMLNSFKSRNNATKSKRKKKEPNTTRNNRDLYLNIVMDCLPQNLHEFNMSYRDKKLYPPIIMAKLFTYEIFLGLQYLHSPEINVTHRDMKPPNVLVDPNSGECKICDFGSAKILLPNETSVSYIASRYYRAPELMFNCPNYTNKIDIWATGCIFAEILLSGTPIFQGQTSMAQLYEIIKVIGQPTDEDLSSFTYDLSEDEMNKVRAIEQVTTLKQLMPDHVPQDCIDLLESIFQYNPQKRPTALECLKHSCFNDLFRSDAQLPNKKPLPPLERFT